jgi:hypothetical protein
LGERSRANWGWADLSLSEIFAKGGQFVLIEDAVFVDVVLFQKMREDLVKPGRKVRRTTWPMGGGLVARLGLGLSGDARQRQSQRGERGEFH